MNSDSANLIVNNILYDGLVGIIYNGATSGNAYSYNYITNMYHDSYPGRGWPGINWHGAEPFMNLIEGNYLDGTAIKNDFSWGSAIYETYFRNRVKLDTSLSINQLQNMDLTTNGWYINIVGNVIGTPGNEDYYQTYDMYDGMKSIYFVQDSDVESRLIRHGNWDSVNNGVVWDPSISVYDIPDSLYMSEIPDWWCQEIPWPPIGSDVTGYYNDIPAKRRYQGLSCTPVGQSVHTCSELGGSCCTSGQLCQGGSFQSSSDCSDCCVGGVCQDPPPTCSELGGSCCTGSAICEGTNLGTTSDCAGTCCSQACTVSGTTVLYLSLDEGSGTTTVDSSGNGNNVNIIGASWTTDSKSGSHALNLNGIDNYINISDSPSMDFDKSQGTIEFWIKPDNPADGDYQLLVLDSDYEIEFNLQGDGDLFYYPYYSPTDWYNYNLVANPLTAGEWHHVAATWDYDTRKASIYVNGYEQTYAEENVNPTNWVTIASTGDWHIGGSPVKNQYFSGIIDDIRVYSSALSPSEILDHYNSASYHRSDTNENGCIETGEMVAFMDRWKISSADVGMVELMESIGLWKAGTGCS